MARFLHVTPREEQWPQRHECDMNRLWRIFLLSRDTACHNWQGEPGPIDCVSTLRLSEFLMARLAWWVVGSQLITTTHTNVWSVATVRHANTTENKSRLDCSCGRALHAHVSALATYDCGCSGRDAAVSPSTAICSKRSTAERSASSSLSQTDPESSASSSLG